ncbi:putative abieta-7,13-dien-18-ol hydroxylase [Rosa chinensis]|uniref:Putative abieta-7,13-dien-18-ol hydroxylase n=1 Tax=Rosa chinensis TaxID=74649 RepID=A0A2P6RRP5_ROSCH|nr:putative abieta-7,13-dien-18-ol hydroxylase [Rosa chinensis]
MRVRTRSFPLILGIKSSSHNMNIILDGAMWSIRYLWQHVLGIVLHDNDKEDILSRFLSKSEKNPEEMNDKYLSEIILNFMISRKDTSANSLLWFFYMLSKNPLT